MTSLLTDHIVTAANPGSQATPKQVKSGQHCKPNALLLLFTKPDIATVLRNRALQPIPTTVLDHWPCRSSFWPFP